MKIEKEHTMKGFLLIALLFAAAQAFCITRTGYYLASKALAEGVGDVTSHAACKYTNATGVNLNGDCPVACRGLIVATWGDCYCTAQSFQPQVGDAPIVNMTVLQIFSFIAGFYDETQAVQSQCRDWMNTGSSVGMWNCNSTGTGNVKIQ